LPKKRLYKIVLSGLSVAHLLAGICFLSWKWRKTMNLKRLATFVAIFLLFASGLSVFPEERIESGNRRTQDFPAKVVPEEESATPVSPIDSRSDKISDSALSPEEIRKAWLARQAVYENTIKTGEMKSLKVPQEAVNDVYEEEPQEFLEEQGKSLENMSLEDKGFKIKAFKEELKPARVSVKKAAAKTQVLEVEEDDTMEDEGEETVGNVLGTDGAFNLKKSKKSKKVVATDDDEVGSFGSTLRSLGVVLVLMGFMGGALIFLKSRNLKKQKKNGGGPMLEVVERMPLGPRREILLLRVGNQRVVVAQMQNDVKALASFSAEALEPPVPSSPFAARLTEQLTTVGVPAGLPNSSGPAALATGLGYEAAEYGRFDAARTGLTDLERAGLAGVRRGLNTAERQAVQAPVAAPTAATVPEPPLALRSFPAPTWPKGPDEPVRRVNVNADYPRTTERLYPEEDEQSAANANAAAETGGRRPLYQSRTNTTRSAVEANA
jgi:flagellar biogenesis protein FliO